MMLPISLKYYAVCGECFLKNKCNMFVPNINKIFIIQRCLLFPNTLWFSFYLYIFLYYLEIFLVFLFCVCGGVLAWQ